MVAKSVDMPLCIAEQSGQQKVSEKRFDLDGAGKARDGLSKLVISIVKLLVDILERQALRRVESGTVTDEETEKLGLAFISIREQLQLTAMRLGISPQELDKELSIMLHGSSETSIGSLIDNLIDRGTVIAGDINIAVAGVDLVSLNLLASLTSVANNLAAKRVENSVSEKKQIKEKMHAAFEVGLQTQRPKRKSKSKPRAIVMEVPNND
jgi:hypothetical protein